jgi:type II secretory pathway pseudopilin PulG
MIQSVVSKKRGFVLLMVLVAIMIVGVALTATARKSLLASLAAIDEQKTMQRRWGMFSCQRTLLPAASGIFEVSDQKSKKQRGKQIAFPAVIEDRIVLGGQAIDLLLADEDAKANLNAIYDAGGTQECEITLNRLTGAMDSRSVRLLPNRVSQKNLAFERQKSGESILGENTSSKEASQVNDAPAFRSWGEVFDLIKVNRFAGDDRQVAKMTKNVTIFGSGRLNVFRASDDAVLAVCNCVAQEGLSKRVLLKIRETFLGEIRLILERSVTNSKDREGLIALLSSSSSSFSLWMEATDKNSRQQRLAIQAMDENGTLRINEFSFE